MKNLKTKMRSQLIIIILLAIVIIASVVSAFVLLLSSLANYSILVIVVTIIVTIILLKVKNNFEYTRHMYTLEELLRNAEKPFKLNKAILNDNYLSQLITKFNYQLYTKTNDYKLYYKIEHGLTKQKRNRILYAILIINNDISFIDKQTNQAYYDLERSLTKKDRYDKRIFFQFKTTKDTFTDEDIEDANKIFFLSVPNENIVVLNTIYDLKNKNIYYLYSNEVKKPYILDIAYNELNKLIKLKVK